MAVPKGKASAFKSPAVVSSGANDPYSAWTDYLKQYPEYYDAMIKAYSNPAAMAAYYNQYYGNSQGSSASFPGDANAITDDTTAYSQQGIPITSHYIPPGEEVYPKNIACEYPSDNIEHRNIKSRSRSRSRSRSPRRHRSRSPRYRSDRKRDRNYRRSESSREREYKADQRSTMPPDSARNLSPYNGSHSNSTDGPSRSYHPYARKN